MFTHLLGILEIIFYVILVFLPIIIFVNLFSRLKKKFFDLRAWEFNLKQEMVLLEIRVSKEITKTPEAMETILSTIINGGGEGNWFKKRWGGSSRPKYSLEIISIDGHVRFYIWSRRGLVKMIESAFYSQYPTVEINEVPDYTKYFSYEKEAAGGMFGFEFNLDKADPIPIKTYKKFGLDKPGLKSDEVVDPMSYTVETLGNIGKGENFWLQFVIKMQKKDIPKKQAIWRDILGLESKEKEDWRATADTEIEKIKKSLTEEDKEGVKFQKISTDREKEVISSIIENVDKPSYWVGARAIYFAEEGKFDADTITPLTMLFQPLTSKDFNNLSFGFVTGFDYQWQDPHGVRAAKLKKTMFSDFKRRKFFEVSPAEKRVWQASGKRYGTFILSTEELATLFHPPTATTASPSFERILSKKGEAPANLPI